MSTAGLDAFDAMVQETNPWLKATMERLESEDRHGAYMALRAVPHALRDRIGPENAVHVGAQLRGICHEGWHMRGTATRERHLPEFVAHVRAGTARHREIDAEAAARAVIAGRVDPGEVRKLVQLLPVEVRSLWPDEPGAA